MKFKLIFILCFFPLIIIFSKNVVITCDRNVNLMDYHFDVNWNAGGGIYPWTSYYGEFMGDGFMRGTLLSKSNTNPHVAGFGNPNLTFNRVEIRGPYEERGYGINCVYDVQNQKLKNENPALLMVTDIPANTEPPLPITHCKAAGNQAYCTDVPG